VREFAAGQIRFNVDPNITLDGILRGSLECGVILLNPQGRVTYADNTACTLLSLHCEAAKDLLLPPELAAFAQRALSDPAAGSPARLHYASPTGDSQEVTAEGVPVSLGGGQTGLLLTLRGGTVEDSFESKIRHFERLARLGVLSASLAHELRNALVALNTMTDLLIEQQQDNELAQTVKRELTRANNLAVRMLKYSRPNPPSRQPTSTHEVLDRALQLANAKFKEAGATVTTSLQAEPDGISADEAHLEQMFLNLLINAADAVDQNGEVTVSTEVVEKQPGGRAVRIAVKDTGIGIPPEVVPNLFEPFFTTKRHGTGLGLYLAQRIIEEHCGTIAVESEPGRGTCVHVMLPAHPA
jgi:two-component system sensor histidine kinase HydH